MTAIDLLAEIQGLPVPDDRTREDVLAHLIPLLRHGHWLMAIAGKQGRN